MRRARRKKGGEANPVADELSPLEEIKARIISDEPPWWKEYNWVEIIGGSFFMALIFTIVLSTGIVRLCAVGLLAVVIVVVCAIDGFMGRDWVWPLTLFFGMSGLGFIITAATRDLSDPLVAVGGGLLGISVIIFLVARLIRKVRLKRTSR